jgi:hypothetical protein
VPTGRDQDRASAFEVSASPSSRTPGRRDGAPPQAGARTRGLDDPARRVGDDTHQPTKGADRTVSAVEHPIYPKVMPLPLGVARAVIADEAYPLRFEQFAASLASRIEGGTRIVTTSSNYDQTRDGVPVGAGPRAYLCCSLTDEVDDKVEADAKKLGKSTKGIERLYFCLSQKLTERAEDRLAATVAKLAGCAGRVTVLGREKLAGFASQYDDILRHHYPAEVKAALQALADGASGSELEQSLRLALSVAGTDDAAGIREGVWASAIRLVLADGVSRTAAELAAHLSNHLKLSAVLRADVLRIHVNEQISHGLVTAGAAGTFALSDKGRAAFAEDEERVAANVLQGRTAFRRAVEQALRQALTDSQANDMWLAIQDALAMLLYQRGHEILGLMAPVFGSAVASSSGDDGGPSGPPSTPSPALLRVPVHKDIVGPIADAAASSFTLKEQGEEVHTAVSDLLHSGDGEAVDWLTRSCFAFVCACSLGLEVRTQAALESIIERTAIVLDTDVVLSLLSIDESAHDSVEVLTKQWREYGGQVLVTKEVLSEVAHHAWIAQVDLDYVADLWPASHLDRQVLSKNAFVRGFGRLLELKQGVKPSHWSRWIRQFKGKSKEDLAAVRTTLTKDYGFGELPPPNTQSRELAKQVRTYLERKHRLRPHASLHDSRADFIRSDKAKRDASLFASIVQAIHQGHDRGDGRATYLITSSGRFRDVQRKFMDGEPSFILSVPAAAYILSMVPGRSLGLSALRAFLFDGRWQERVSDFQLLALRIVKRSAEFDIPWAKRSALLRDLRGRVESVARDRSNRRHVSPEAADKIEEEWMAKGSDELSKALALALDQVAADRSTEVRLTAAEQRIHHLEAQLTAERRKNAARKRAR